MDEVGAVFLVLVSFGMNGLLTISPSWLLRLDKRCDFCFNYSRAELMHHYRYLVIRVRCARSEVAQQESNDCTVSDTRNRTRYAGVAETEPSTGSTKVRSFLFYFTSPSWTLTSHI